MHDIIEKYISQNNQEFERYNSWNHCYKAFEKIEDDNLLGLNLAFYLASWGGMYRGSSKLLSHDYLIHVKAVSIINEFQILRCTPNNEVSFEQIDTIGILIDQLSSYYQEFDITPTDTLISKIILGTLGCLPAFDRFFIDGGVKSQGQSFTTLKRKSLEGLFEFVEEKQDELVKIQKKHSKYPPKMKLVDMYFWQIGFDKKKGNR